MTENIDYGDTDLRSIIEGDRHNRQDESFGNYGYQEQEFKDNELVAVEDDYIEDSDADEDPDIDFDDSFDAEDASDFDENE